MRWIFNPPVSYIRGNEDKILDRTIDDFLLPFYIFFFFFFTSSCVQEFERFEGKIWILKLLFARKEEGIEWKMKESSWGMRNFKVKLRTMKRWNCETLLFNYAYVVSFYYQIYRFIVFFLSKIEIFTNSCVNTNIYQHLHEFLISIRFCRRILLISEKMSKTIMKYSIPWLGKGRPDARQNAASPRSL